MITVPGGGSEDWLLAVRGVVCVGAFVSDVCSLGILHWSILSCRSAWGLLASIGSLRADLNLMMMLGMGSGPHSIQAGFAVFLRANGLLILF